MKRATEEVNKNKSKLLKTDNNPVMEVKVIKNQGLVDSSIKLENVDKTESQLPSILKENNGLVTKIINENYGLATVNLAGRSIGVLFDTCEFWHNGTVLTELGLPLHKVICEGDWLNINAIKIIKDEQGDDRNIFYLAIDVCKVGKQFWDLAIVKNLDDIPQGKKDTFHSVLSFLKSVPISNIEKDMIYRSRSKFKIEEAVVKNEEAVVRNEETMVQDEEAMVQDEEAMVKDEEVVVKDILDHNNHPRPILPSTHICELCGYEPKLKNKSRERRDHMAHEHFKQKLLSELRKDKPLNCSRCEVFVGKDKLNLFRHMMSSHNVLDQYLAEALENIKNDKKVSPPKAMVIPKGVPKASKDKKGNLIENPNVVPLGKGKCFGGKDNDLQAVSLEAFPKGVPKASEDKRGNIIENPNVCFPRGPNVSLIGLRTFFSDKDKKLQADIPKAMVIPKGVPKASKDKKGNVIENPNVAPLGPKTSTLDGKSLSPGNMSIINLWKRDKN